MTNRIMELDQSNLLESKMNKLHPKLVKSLLFFLNTFALYEYRFFGEFSLYIDYIEVDREDKNLRTAGVGLINNKITMFYNPKFIDDLTDKQVNFLYLHEIYHLLGNCRERVKYSSLNHRYANIAHDMVINFDILNDPKLKGYVESIKYGVYIPKNYKGDHILEAVYTYVREHDNKAIEFKKQQEQQKQQQDQSKKEEPKTSQLDQQQKDQKGDDDLSDLSNDIDLSDLDDLDDKDDKPQDKPKNKNDDKGGDDQQQDDNQAKGDKDGQTDNDDQQDDNQSQGNNDGQADNNDQQDDNQSQGNNDGQTDNNDQQDDNQSQGNNDGQADDNDQQQGNGQGQGQAGQNNAPQGQRPQRNTNNEDLNTDPDISSQVDDSLLNEHGMIGDLPQDRQYQDLAEDGCTLDQHDYGMEEYESELLQEQANEIINALRNRGLISGDLQKVIDKLTKKPNNWLGQLKRWVVSAKGTGTFSKTFQKPNRYQIEGLRGRKKNAIIFDVLLDTSGSMTHDIPKVLGTLLSDGIQCNIIQCDTQVQSDTLITNKSDIKTLNLKGFGGTTLQPAIDYITSKRQTKRPLVIMTDGYTDTLDVSKITTKVIVLFTGTEPPMSDTTRVTFVNCSLY